LVAITGDNSATTLAVDTVGIGYSKCQWFHLQSVVQDSLYILGIDQSINQSIDPAFLGY